jgi:hypothetical protein
MFIISVIIPIILLASPLILMIMPMWFCQWLGSIVITQLFVIFLLAILTWANFRPDPVIIFVIFAALWSWFDLNDNHHIRPLFGVSPTINNDLGASFHAWLEARADNKKFARYPVYVVAARGGGIYAAYHSAMFLARMQDYCPSFAQHIFAISSVSGGSLGAAAFAALAQESAHNKEENGCIERGDVKKISDPASFSSHTTKILAADFLSPTLSAALFPDLLMRALGTIRLTYHPT